LSNWSKKKSSGKSLAEFDPGYGTRVAKSRFFSQSVKKDLGTSIGVHSKHQHSRMVFK
jgi:hypothetical protein